MLLATKRNHLDIIQYLCEQGCDLNMQNMVCDRLCHAGKTLECIECHDYDNFEYLKCFVCYPVAIISFDMLLGH